MINKQRGRKAREGTRAVVARRGANKAREVLARVKRRKKKRRGRKGGER